MRFETLTHGFVCRNGPDTGGLICVGPRCLVTGAGALLVSYMVQSKLGVNDFLPALSRSGDGGKTWSHPGPIWPEFRAKRSCFGSISRAPDGQNYFYGKAAPIDQVGEPVWSDAVQGLKFTQLVWARANANGSEWSDLHEIEKPEPCGVEAPGALTVTRAGVWLAPYAPYNSFDPSVQVRRNRVMAARSADGGRSWRHVEMISLPEGSGAAEAWVVELANGHLLATCWHNRVAENTDMPNAFAMSSDAGQTWHATGSTATQGQSTALTPLPATAAHASARALFIYNDRKGQNPGVRIAVCAPTPDRFNILHDELAWSAATRTQSGTSGDHAGWTDFSFGEPAACLLPDGTICLCLWSLQPGGEGVAFVRLRLADE